MLIICIRRMDSSHLILVSLIFQPLMSIPYGIMLRTLMTALPAGEGSKPLMLALDESVNQNGESFLAFPVFFAYDLLIFLISPAHLTGRMSIRAVHQGYAQLLGGLHDPRAEVNLPAILLK